MSYRINTNSHLIALTVRLSLVPTPFDDLLAGALWTPYTLRPTQLAHAFIAFGIIKQVDQIQHLRITLLLLVS